MRSRQTARSELQIAFASTPGISTSPRGSRSRTCVTGRSPTGFRIPVKSLLDLRGGTAIIDERSNEFFRRGINNVAAISSRQEGIKEPRNDTEKETDKSWWRERRERERKRFLDKGGTTTGGEKGAEGRKRERKRRGRWWTRLMHNSCDCLPCIFSCLNIWIPRSLQCRESGLGKYSVAYSPSFFFVTLEPPPPEPEEDSFLRLPSIPFQCLACNLEAACLLAFLPSSLPLRLPLVFVGKKISSWPRDISSSYFALLRSFCRTIKRTTERKGRVYRGERPGSTSLAQKEGEEEEKGNESGEVRVLEWHRRCFVNLPSITSTLVRNCSLFSE